MKARLYLDKRGRYVVHHVVCRGMRVGEIMKWYHLFGDGRRGKVWIAVAFLRSRDFVEAPYEFLRRGDAKRWVLQNQTEAQA